MASYFYTHISRLLNFDTDNVVSFDTKYFFHFLDLFTKDSIYSQKNYTKNDNKYHHLSNNKQLSFDKTLS